MKSVYLLDFEDSFTFNIASVVTSMGFDVQVIPFSDVKVFLETFHPSVPVVLIYGPGPGHPADQFSLFSSVRRLRQNPFVFHMGICLGHQILGLIDGGVVAPCLKPIHGRSISFKIPRWVDVFTKEDWDKTLKVQKYNSLCLKMNSTISDEVALENECLARRFPGGVSYQFHPESVGTTDPSAFFAALRDFFQQKSQRSAAPHLPFSQCL